MAEINTTADRTAKHVKSEFTKMFDRLCELHPEAENYHETRVMVCEEFLKVVKKMQPEDLEPYLAGISGVLFQGCIKIQFNIPVFSYEEIIKKERRK